MLRYSEPEEAREIQLPHHTVETIVQSNPICRAIIAYISASDSQEAETSLLTVCSTIKGANSTERAEAEKAWRDYAQGHDGQQYREAHLLFERKYRETLVNLLSKGRDGAYTATEALNLLRGKDQYQLEALHYVCKNVHIIPKDLKALKYVLNPHDYHISELGLLRLDLLVQLVDNQSQNAITVVKAQQLLDRMSVVRLCAIPLNIYNRQLQEADIALPELLERINNWPGNFTEDCRRAFLHLLESCWGGALTVSEVLNFMTDLPENKVSGVNAFFGAWGLPSADCPIELLRRNLAEFKDWSGKIPFGGRSGKGSHVFTNLLQTVSAGLALQLIQDFTPNQLSILDEMSDFLRRNRAYGYLETVDVTLSNLLERIKKWPDSNCTDEHVCAIPILLNNCCRQGGLTASEVLNFMTNLPENKVPIVVTLSMSKWHRFREVMLKNLDELEAWPGAVPSGDPALSVLGLLLETGTVTSALQLIQDLTSVQLLIVNEITNFLYLNYQKEVHVILHDLIKKIKKWPSSCADECRKECDNIMSERPDPPLGVLDFITGIDMIVEYSGPLSLERNLREFIVGYRTFHRPFGAYDNQVWAVFGNLLKTVSVSQAFTLMSHLTSDRLSAVCHIMSHLDLNNEQLNQPPLHVLITLLNSCDSAFTERHLSTLIKLASLQPPPDLIKAIIVLNRYSRDQLEKPNFDDLHALIERLPMEHNTCSSRFFRRSDDWLASADMWSYRLMSVDQGEPKVHEMVFSIASDDVITVKIKNKYDFIVPLDNPIHGVIISANIAGHFTPEQEEQLRRSMLLGSHISSLNLWYGHRSEIEQRSPEEIFREENMSATRCDAGG